MTLRTPTLTLVLALAMPLAHAATLDYDVGAAGKCYDAPGEGGETELVLASDRDPAASVLAFDPVQAALAVVAFVDEPAETAESNGCASDDAVDYLEVHVFVDVLEGADEVHVEACYAGDTAAILTTSCYPTRP